MGMEGIGQAFADAMLALLVIGVAVGLTLGAAGMWLWNHVGIVWPFYWK